MTWCLIPEADFHLGFERSISAPLEDKVPSEPVKRLAQILTLGAPFLHKPVFHFEVGLLVNREVGAVGRTFARKLFWFGSGRN